MVSLDAGHSREREGMEEEELADPLRSDCLKIMIKIFVKDLV